MTMANLQKLNPTQQELYNYLEQQTGQVNFEVLQPFTTQEMGAVLHISRNTVSQYLNEFFKEGWMVKINTRPVYYFLRETLSRKFNVQTLDAEYEDLQFLQQDLNHGRRADSCFAGVIGYHLSLKSAVETLLMIPRLTFGRSSRSSVMFSSEPRSTRISTSRFSLK